MVVVVTAATARVDALAADVERFRAGLEYGDGMREDIDDCFVLFFFFFFFF